MIRLLPVGAFLLLFLWLPIDPAEDAHIMFRYAENFASGQGLVWNAGLPPVEGATEFLWTLLLALPAFLRAPLGISAQVLGVLAVLLTLLVTMRFCERDLDLPPWVGALASLPVAVGPLVVQTRSGFGTALFTLLLTLLWIQTWKLTDPRRRVRTRDPRIFGVLWLLLGLTRPEGVFFGALLAGGVLLLHPVRRGAFLREVAWTFLLPGAIYFIARWTYYGYPLPNTFYAKQGGALFHPTGIPATLVLAQALLPIWPFLAALPLLLPSDDRKRFAAMVLPLLLFPLSYLGIEQMQNIGFRFQFPVMPSLLLAVLGGWRTMASTPPDLNRDRIFLLINVLWNLVISILVIAMLGDVPSGSPILAGVGLGSALLAIVGFLKPRLLRRGVLVAAVACTVLSLSGQALVLSLTRTESRYDHRVTMGVALRPWAHRGYTMVSSEAGWLPHFSGWRTVDPFGLYDSHIAHAGLSDGYLDRVKPTLIMFHVYCAVWQPEWSRGDARWNVMTQHLYRYAEKRGYQRVAVVGSFGDCFWYYLNPRCSDFGTLVTVICNQKSVPYVDRVWQPLRHVP